MALEDYNQERIRMGFLIGDRSASAQGPGRIELLR
jgi:hypothetical protein